MTTVSTDSASDPRVGTVLEGAYRITRVIGRGGMSTVYEATQLRLGKRMAIKILATNMTTNERVMARFHREAEITSRLGHPHLVSVLDRGRAATGEPYLVMEYLEGEDLDQRLGRVRRMPIEEVVRVVMQTASALSAAHAQGVVHRDLKPANIFLEQVSGEPDFVKVLDFGVSKLIAAHTRLTKQAVAVGTPYYMAPEQATGMIDSIDHRIDQWALACIAWEMLLGVRPFVAVDPMEVLHQIVTTEPAPLTPRVPGLPLTVEPILRRALHKRAANRFDSIREFSHAFASAALGQQIDVTPPVGIALPLGSADAANAATTNSPVGSLSDSPSAASASASGRSRSPNRAPWHRLKKNHVIVAAASVLLLLGGVLLLRPGTRPQATPKATDQRQGSPSMDAQPALPPAVPPETTATNPAAPETVPARAKPTKSPKARDRARPPRLKKPSTHKPRGKRPLFNKL
jgi:serine/threonine protein kinase